MRLTEDQWVQYNKATHCHIGSKGDFNGTNHKVRHRRISVCNLNYKFKSDIPVIFHNLRGYDSHLIMQGIHKY